MSLEEQQEGLPEEIKSKIYPSSNLLSAEDELLEDLKSHSLEDSDKVIVINEDGKAIWSFPTVFHRDALQKLLKIVNKCSSGAEDPSCSLKRTFRFSLTRRRASAGTPM